MDDRENDPLVWLSDVLWPGGDARLLVDRRRSRSGLEQAHIVAAGARDHHVGYRWWASPDPGRAQILIPATSIAAARTAVRRYHDGYTLKRRARSWSAELLMRSPALAARLLDTKLVAAAGRVDDGLLSDLVVALADHGPISELHVAVTLARPKSNRKPVLQLIDSDGTCLGWAKVGWNKWTRQLVANEADWLERDAAGPMATPRLLSRLDLRAHHVVITSGVKAGRRPRLHSHRPPPAELFLAIAAKGDRSRSKLADTSWWRSVERVAHAATAEEASAIQRVIDLVGSASLEVGAWHGDLTPWNIITPAITPALTPALRTGLDSSVPTVIDWEFAADGVPLGFDLCHFHTQVAVEMKNLSTSEALDHSARLSPQGLARLGVDPHNQINVYRLYLVELIRRTLALRAAGMPVDGVEQGAAAVARIGNGRPVRDRAAVTVEPVV